MIMNIIFFATMYPIVFIMLFLFSTQNKYENGRLFAVNMKKEWIKDATVADIRQKFKKEMRYYSILLAIVPFVSLLTSHMSIQLTIWMFWLLAAIFLLSLPIMRANHRLKTWKTQNHLYEDRQPEHYVELKQAGSVRKVRFLPFFLPNIISIASALLLLPKSSGLGISCLIGASCGLVFWLAAVWIDRQPVSVISTDSDVNINYARAKKNRWKNFWLISCWLNTALILFLEILTLSARHMGICSIAGMIVYTLLLLLLCIFCMIKLKKIDRQSRDYKSGVAKKRFEDDLQRAKDAAMAKSGYSEEEIKKLKRAKADPIIAPSKGQVLWEVSVEGPSSAPFIGRKYQHDEVFCYLSTPWGEYEKIWTGFTGRVVEVCAKQGDVVNKGDVIAYIQRSDIFA